VIDEGDNMGKKRKGQIRIIKHGTANNVLVSQAAIRQCEKQAKDPMEPLIRGVSGWVTEFKARSRPNPKVRFQALFKEA
jgi:hypothetical protein